MKKLLEYKTSDLSCVTTLSLWVSIKSIQMTDAHRAIFIFEKNTELDDLLKKYWRRELLVEPRAYFEQLRSIKTRIYELS